MAKADRHSRKSAKLKAKKDHTVEDAVHLLQSLIQGEDEDPLNFFIRVQGVLDVIGAKRFDFNAWAYLLLLLGLTEASISFFNLKDSKIEDLLQSSEKTLVKDEAMDSKDSFLEEEHNDDILEQELDKVLDMNLSLEDIVSLNIGDDSCSPRIVEEDGITFFVCALCRQMFPSKESFLSHAKADHSGSIFKCKQCQFHSRLMNTLQNHQIDHHSPFIALGKIQDDVEEMGDPSQCDKSQSSLEISKDVPLRRKKIKKAKEKPLMKVVESEVPNFIQKGFMDCRRKPKKRKLTSESDEVKALEDDVKALEDEVKDQEDEVESDHFLDEEFVEEEEKVEDEQYQDEKVDEKHFVVVSSNGEIIVKDYDVFPKHWKDTKGGKFSCRVCQKPQKSYKALVLHEWRQHQGQIAFHCDVCDESFIHRRDRLYHRMKYHGTENKMPVVPRNNTVQNDSKNDQTKVNPEGTVKGMFRCGICGRFQKSHKDLVSHQERYHKDQKAYICDLCGKSFLRKQDRLVHKLKEHEQEKQDVEMSDVVDPTSKTFKCEICKENFTSVDGLEKHLEETHMGEKTEQVEGLIEYPGLSRAGKFPLYEDIINQMDAGRTFCWPPRAKKDFDLVLICIWCKIPFVRKVDLKTHCVQKHSGFVVRCDQCEFKGKNKSKLAAHRLKKHNLQTEGMGKYDCELCDFKATIKSTLERHVVDKHSRTEDGDSDFVRANQRSHICEICGNEFSYKRTLDHHREVFHLSKRRFDCEICGRGYHSPKALELHVWKVHEPHKPSPQQAICDICGKKMNSALLLNRHKKYHEEKQEVCKHCSKAFCTLRELRRHMMRHLKIYPFECKLCKKNYSQSQHLAYHICVNHMGLSASEGNKKENRALARVHEAYVANTDMYKQALEDMPVPDHEAANIETQDPLT